MSYSASVANQSYYKAFRLILVSVLRCLGKRERETNVGDERRRSFVDLFASLRAVRTVTQQESPLFDLAKRNAAALTPKPFSSRLKLNAAAVIKVE